jgi:hypothetical protein
MDSAFPDTDTKRRRVVSGSKQRTRGLGAVLGDMIIKFPIPTLPEIEPSPQDCQMQLTIIIQEQGVLNISVLWGWQLDFNFVNSLPPGNRGF